MLSLNKDSVVILYNKPVNLHRGFDSLANVAQTELGLELVPNTYVLFSNVKRTRVKILYFDGNFLSLLAMRFENTLAFKYGDVMCFDEKSFWEFMFKRASRNGSTKYKSKKS